MSRLFALTIVPLCAVALTNPSLRAADVSGDSTRGSEVFVLQGCGNCHALNGVGPQIGPDLGRIADRGFTPSTLAATMWNHAPAMWGETRLRSVALPSLSEQQSADLFAFFYGLRFFEEPGDAGRGKSLFGSLKCSECHGLNTPKQADAKAVTQWTAPGDPLEMVETMWNHSTAMRAEMERRKIKLPQLSGQELADLLVYVRSVQGLPRRTAEFHPGSPEQGKAFFESKTCIQCHDPATGFFAIGLRNETLTDIAADMWNHGRDMSLRGQTFDAGQMRAIASYIWSRRLLETDGNPSSGANVFVSKKCGTCHNDPSSGAPPLTARGNYFSGATMVSVLTRHGPAMLDKMREKHLAWPTFSGNEMANLIAYLNTRDSRNGR
ncbi:MAG TPA: c-type cytochrome [Bryobacteraceae bacterium]|jgi:mono/diheme cytochrome c family protein|nr:c-type cytochrome [Bryobacteraceae bacterium]